MEYDFYQKIMPIGKLIKVGRAFVPDNRPMWSFAPKHEMTIGHAEDILTTPTSTLYERIDYHKVKTISGTMFIAVVYPKVKK